MGCSNCFNGCADIISDQCVKYTGVDIPGLGIVNGDSLLTVENQIINKILTLITGEGILPIIDPLDICSFVSGFLPVSGDITLNDVISALFRSICNIDGRLVSVEGTLVNLNADYVIGCLSGVSINSGTHDILQATIDKLCEVNTDLNILTVNVGANYVLVSQIDNYIAAYLAGIPSSTLYNTKMIPYTAMPYFGSLVGFFDITGAGIGDWEKIYLCNGQNGTPDLRGRVLVGATTMGTTPFNPAVDPAILGNPTYSQNTVVGSNLAVLTNPNQLPPHIHGATAIVTDPGHNHDFGGSVAVKAGVGPDSYSTSDNYPSHDITATLNKITGISVAVTVGSTGASAGHNNIQPVHASNYIIYIP